MRKVYARPHLREMGSFEQITKANGVSTDFDFFCKLADGSVDSTQGSGPGTGSCL
jgi:hypothetical protein